MTKNAAINVICAVIGVVFLILAITSCGPTVDPAGTVVDQDKRALTIRQADGTEPRITVSKKVARSCPKGATYPKCADDPSWSRR